uniref:Fumarylacetoacetase-like C-terminal domain-containing protein n=1 Tax=Aplanochytrium stocchinoi TaxID=215587 RepID=A0A7S3V000_9STRA
MSRLFKILTESGKASWAVGTRPVGQFINKSAATIPSSFYLLNEEDQNALESGNDFMDVMSRLDSPKVDDRQQVSAKAIVPPLPRFGTPCLYAAGLNYKKHAEEAKLTPAENPTIIIQAASCVTGHNSPIRIPKVCPKPEVDYEAELAIVIGRSCVDVKTPEDALGCIAGFTIANDISARRWQGKKGGGQWGRSKSFDTFTPLGPCLVPSFAVSQPQNLDIELSVKRLNEGALVMQRSNTKDMIHSIGELVTYISQDTTLKPWTVILTGTPEGVGYVRNPPFFLQPGDEVSISIEDLGTLVNTVVGNCPL